MKWHLLGFLQGFLYQLLSDDRRDSHLQNFIVCPLSRNEKCNCLVNSIFYQLAVLERKGPKNFEKIANNKKPKKWPITKNLKKRQIKKKLSRNEKCNCLVNSIFYLRERAAHQRRGEKTKIALLTFLLPPQKYCQEKKLIRMCCFRWVFFCQLSFTESGKESSKKRHLQLLSGSCFNPLTKYHLLMSQHHLEAFCTISVHG